MIINCPDVNTDLTDGCSAIHTYSQVELSDDIAIGMPPGIDSSFPMSATQIVIREDYGYGATPAF